MADAIYKELVMEQNPIDLTKFCVGFPEKPRDEIHRENLIKMIADSFSEQNQSILISGGAQTGKTTILAQFARQFPYQSISYFISSNPWSQNCHVFVLSICSQISMLLGLRTPKEDIDLGSLQSLLESLSFRLAYQARKTNNKYYFLIDGLEYALNGPQGQRIIDVFPPLLDVKSPFLLASCRTDFVSKISKLDNFHNIPAVKFSLRDTLLYLKALGISDDIVKEIHDKADGIPGYIKTIKEMCEASPCKVDLTSLPSKFEELVIQKWNLIYENSAPHIKEALELLSASPLPLKLNLLAGILNCEPKNLGEVLISTGIIEIDRNSQNCIFGNNVLREVAKKRLSNKLNPKRRSLIEFLEKQNPTENTSELLTLLYKETGNFEGIGHVLAPSKIVEKIGTEENLAAVYRDLSRACEMSEESSERNSTYHLLRWAFALSLLRLVMLYPVDEDEVEAFLSLGRIDEAKRRAYAVVERPTKVRLLAKSYTAQKKRGQRLSNEAKEELERLVNDLDFKNIEKELLMQISIELFPVFPDLATNLLEKSIQSDEKRNIIDLALTAATLSSPVAPDTNSILNISNPDLVLVAKTHSSWLSTVSIEDLERDLANIEATKAKEYVIRKWCESNPSSPHLHLAINRWLDEVIADLEFPIPLRSLRKLSDNLLNISVEHRAELIRRFDVPRITSLESPKEELVRFLLNLAEGALEIDAQDALYRLESVDHLVNEDIPDLDTKVYCLARLWLSTSRIKGACAETDFTKKKFWKESNTLLEQTADHLEITKGILRTLVQIEPIQGIDLAGRLNTIDRRNKAIGIVLANTLLRNDQQDWTEMLDLGFGYSDVADHPFILQDIISIIEKRKETIALVNISYIRKKIKDLADNDERAKLYSILASHAAKNDTELANELALDAMTSWKLIDDLRKKIKIGYRLVVQISEFNTETAETLLDSIEKLFSIPGSQFASGNLGPAFFDAVGLTIASVQIQDLTSNGEQINRLKGLIKRLPSKGAQAQLFAELAAVSYRCGYTSLGDQLASDEVLSQLSGSSSSIESQKLLAFSAPVLFEYDSNKTKDLLSNLSPYLKEKSWFRICLWTLVQCQLEADIDAIDLRVHADHRRILKAVSAAENISYDSILYTAIKAILNVTDVSFEMRNIDGVQAMEVLRKLEAIAASKLPDQTNIKQHNGYELIVKAGILRIKSHIVEREKKKKGHTNLSRHTNLTEVEVQKDWKNINKLTEAILNVADRVYVRILISQEMLQCKRTKDLGEIVLHSALNEIKLIPSIIDRGDRLQIIATAFEKAGLKSESRFALEQAIELASELEGVERRNLVSMVVQAAYRIDPDFATEMTNRLDSRDSGIPEQIANDALQTERLLEDPSLLIGDAMNNSVPPWVIGKAAKKLLVELVSGRDTIRHEKIYNQWLQISSTTHISVFRDVLRWVIESLRRRGGMPPMLSELIELPRLTLELAKSISPQRRLGVSDFNIDSYPGLVSKLHVFEAGERCQAVEWISKWINSNANQYLKIVDPYFQSADLIFFKDLPVDCKVLIVTTDIYIKGNPDSIQKEFAQQWRSISSRRIPTMLIYAVPQYLENLFHDRAIITYGSGLDVGQSLNGIGLNYGKVTELTESDSKDLETTYVDHMLDQSNWFLNHSTTPAVIRIQ